MKLRHLKQERGTLPRTVEVATDRQEQEGFHFDHRRELTKDDRESSLQFLIERRRTLDMESAKELSDYVGMALELIALFPEEKDRIQLDAELYTHLHDQMQANSDKLYEFSLFADVISRLFPDRRGQLGIDDLFEDLQDELEDCSDHGWQIYSKMACRMIFMFPDRRNELGLDARSDGMISVVKFFVDSGSSISLREMATASLIYPERRDEFVNPEIVDRFYSKLQQERVDGDWRQVVQHAFHLAVSTADEIRITSQGLEFISREGLQDKPDLPDRNLVR